MKEEFWKKFDEAYPNDSKLLQELFEKAGVMRMIRDETPIEAAYSILASYFRDAIEYGYNKARNERYRYKRTPFYFRGKNP